MYVLRVESSGVVSKHPLCVISQFVPCTVASLCCSLVPKESLGKRLFGRVFEGLFAGGIVTASESYGL